jgi:Uma2 family endonuclease
MISPIIQPATLTTGEQMDRTEFLCRWEALPELKCAELIDGAVFVASPVSIDHGDLDVRIAWWLKHYAFSTPGCEAGNNTTWWMLESAPQPDVHLRIHPERGGQSSLSPNARYPMGAPELAVEICLTSTEVDFGPKLRLYQRAGVREYITIELLLNRIVWRVLRNNVYDELKPDADGVMRSIAFPGLCLDVDAFWRNDGSRMMATLQAGLETVEHKDFVERLRGG